MYFLPTSDQLDLSRGVRDLLAARLPLDRLESTDRAALWQALVDTGVFALRTELGLGMVDAVLVFEELGRAAVPGPLVGTFLAAGRVDGRVAVVEAQRHPLLVTHLEDATALLVVEPGSAWLADPVTGTPVAEPLDPLSPVHELASVPGGAGDALADGGLVGMHGALLTAAIQVGLAARLTDLAVEYAKQREQFGAVIGSFQAVKHLCADMFVRAELARAALHAAAVAADDDEAGDVRRAVAAAKLLADEAATGNGRSCVQVHGGMGFTWEVPVHFLVKRAWVHATEFGTADEHAEALATLL